MNRRFGVTSPLIRLAFDALAFAAPSGGRTLYENYLKCSLNLLVL
jgi:hypothetical protein